MLFLSIGFVFFTLTLTLIYSNFKKYVQPYKKLKSFNTNCNLVGKNVLHGSEDLTKLNETKIFISSGDLHTVFEINENQAKKG